jgi:ribosomal 30S subunit maturation factor RimM
MRGAAIWIGESECEAAEAAYALADLQDLEVQDTEGRRIGKVADVYATGAHGVIEIATGGGMTLSVPVIEPVIASVDLEQGVIVVNDIAPYAVESAGEPAQPEGA